ncbi:MAG: sigma 54-interacting transcriptional regulator [Bacteroidales bacterium]
MPARIALVNSGNHGTLLFDEIEILSLPLQSKILTALQNREIICQGSNKPIPIDIRLISATNRDLTKMISMDSSGKICCTG